MATSSPLSTPPASNNSANSQAGQTPFHRTRELPFELCQQVLTYYEETLFLQAFNFLLSITSNSISNPDSPVTIPPASHLGLAATLAAHPSTTTRTTSVDKHAQRNAALRLLSLLLSTTGPINTPFSAAFHFRRYTRSPTPESDPSSYLRLNTRYATTHSLFNLAEDFWAIVGWSFNCSCLPPPHHYRWTQAWQPLLAFMTSLLELDWAHHYSNNTTEESLIWSYVELAQGNWGRARRIIRAVFADGAARDLKEFHEIFSHELKVPPTDDANKAKEKRDKVNVNDEFYADYENESESDVSDPETAEAQNPSRASSRRPQRTRTPSRRSTPSARSSHSSLHSAYSTSEDASTTTTTLGGADALSLRLRLLHLLSHVAGHPTLNSTSPSTFADLDELYTLFVEFIRPLPLVIFAQIILPNTATQAKGGWSKDAQSALLELMCQRMLEDEAPTVRDERYLTATKLIQYYLPFAAAGGTATAQAKVALVLEGMLRLAESSGLLNELDAQARTELTEAAERGIRRREEMAREGLERKTSKTKGRKKGSGEAATEGKSENEEETAWKGLVDSGRRVLAVIALVE